MAGIYVHVPFCRQRCSYCDFYFVTSHRRVEDFVDAVCREVSLRADALETKVSANTLYFGGGTPSRLSTDRLGRIIEAVAAHFDAQELREVTLEVNPEDPDDEYLDQLLAIGFTRLSIGVQSLHEDDLRFMNRSHTPGQAVDLVERALRAGFSSVSIDLIFGTPEMTLAEWRENLGYAVSSGVQHVSLYGLTVEPRTLLGKWVENGRVTPAPEASMVEQFRAAHEVMTANGFEHYEISNFAKRGHRSFHNGSYWNHSPYLGFGPSAHSFLTEGAAVRSENVRSLSRYLECVFAGELPVSAEETLDVDRMMREYVLLGLRTDTGVDLRRLESVYGCHLTAEGARLISELADAGKVKLDGTRLTLTLDGQLVADSVTSALLRGNAIEQVPGG